MVLEKPLGPLQAKEVPMSEVPSKATSKPIQAGPALALALGLVAVSTVVLAEAEPKQASVMVTDQSPAMEALTLGSVPAAALLGSVQA